MENVIVSKIVGADEESGLDKRVDVTKVQIDLKNKFVEVYYDVNLVNKKGIIIATQISERAYIRRNIMQVMGTRPKEGNPGEMEDYVVSPADNKFDRLVQSEVGQAIQAMLSQDLEKYPELN